MGKRRLSREYSLQTLYLSDVGNFPAQETDLLNLADTEQPDADTADFAAELVTGVTQNKDSLDAAITRYATNWKLDRMSAVDRCILRQAAFEIIHTDTPLPAVIDEAIELAKKYSTENSGRFINGLLDKMKAERQSA